ncbi:PDGLE domain-containing protein [Pseudanabaena sp. PCC 6802]|uniref:PDGLE domain-containing protein n=1 Tax=Pseudanabaena sp. PCC 6802 TaxID=118173 RepID=UPI0003475708|nr:PDGLE domain-containing protein [Pseudanabaena sp. PCC 6802]
MSQKSSSAKNRVVVLVGLGTALVIAIFLSPFASKNPDGLDRVAQDLKFEEKALEELPAKQLPFAKIFDEYALKGIQDEKVATALAGLVGTLVTFSLAWGVGKLTVRQSHDRDASSDRDRNG